MIFIHFYISYKINKIIIEEEIELRKILKNIIENDLYKDNIKNFALGLLNSLDVFKITELKQINKIYKKIKCFRDDNKIINER